MIYAVIDTNVLVSALITHNPQAATSTVVGLMLQGTFTPLYDGDVIEEYREVLHRDKFKLLPGVVDSLISYIIELGVEMSRTAFPEPMPDEDDRVFYEIALTNEDSFLVTGNSKHYPNTPQVITPSEFLNVVVK
jgi:putative PIN family toxin of toxin-antitoxin system